MGGRAQADRQISSARFGCLAFTHHKITDFNSGSMTSFPRPRRSPGASAFAIMLMIAVLALAPSVAWGGCSHDVASRLGLEKESLALDPLIQPETDHASSPLPSPSPERPCTGLFCSGQPSVPHVPPSLSRQIAPTWAWISRGEVPVSDGDAFPRLTSEPAPPVVTPLGIFHPPR